MPRAIKTHKTAELKKLKNHNPKLVDEKKPYSIFKKYYNLKSSYLLRTSCMTS